MPTEPRGAKSSGPGGGGCSLGGGLLVVVPIVVGLGGRSEADAAAVARGVPMMYSSSNQALSIKERLEFIMLVNGTPGEARTDALHNTTYQCGLVESAPLAAQKHIAVFPR